MDVDAKRRSGQALIEALTEALRKLRHDNGKVRIEEIEKRPRITERNFAAVPLVGGIDAEQKRVADRSGAEFSDEFRLRCYEKVGSVEVEAQGIGLR